jgi:hypothetical protein
MREVDPQIHAMGSLIHAGSGVSVRYLLPERSLAAPAVKAQDEQFNRVAVGFRSDLNFGNVLQL